MKPGESKKRIRIPLLNDPSGKTRNFSVSIKEVTGRDSKGDLLTTKVVVANKASKYHFEIHFVPF